jgi:hypothetical protein
MALLATHPQAPPYRCCEGDVMSASSAPPDHALMQRALSDALHYVDLVQANLSDMIDRLTPVDVVMASGLSAKEIEGFREGLIAMEGLVNEIEGEFTLCESELEDEDEDEDEDAAAEATP